MNPHATNRISHTMMAVAGAPHAAVNKKQALTITGTPTGGTFTVTVGADIVAALSLGTNDTTTDLSFDIDAAGLLAALVAVVGAGNVDVTGTAMPAGTLTIELKGLLGGWNWSLFTTVDSLTGGTDPASAIANSQTGVAASCRGAEKGAQLLDTTNHVLYENTGTSYVPVWTEFAE